MPDVTASRTLVKSPPELWTECSDAASLGRHLDRFGEIRITRLEPETAVAWEGELASGTVRLEPSGWGTRVVLTARPVEPAADVSPGADVSRAADVSLAAEPLADAEPEADEGAAPARVGLFARMRRALRRSPANARPKPETVPESEPVSEPGPEAGAEPPTTADVAPEAALAAALDSLGQAHHRPFSRA
jgi:hypothetical protein